MTREIVIELDASLANRILDLRDAGNGELLMVTSERAIWRSLGTGQVRTAPFQAEENLFPARIVDDSRSMGFIGMSSSSCVVLLDGSGRRVACYPSSSSGEMLAADIEGDSEIEIIVESTDRKGIVIYRRSGELLRRIPVGGFLTALEALDIDGDGKAEIIVQIYPDNQGSGKYSVMSSDGKILQAWTGAPVEDVEPVPWSEEMPAILTLEEDGVAVTAPLTVARLRTLPAPGVGVFRDVHAALLPNGHRVVVASGDGYRPYHMVALFTAEDELIYQEFGAERAYGLAAPSWAKGAFFVAVGHRVWRYQPSS